MPIETIIIFLDRSVFESENFFSGLKIKKLVSFAKKGVIELKITEVTYRELQKGLKEHLVKTKRILKQVRKDGRVLKNLSKYDAFNEATYMDIDSDYKELCNLLDKFIYENNIEIIDNSYIELKDVIDDYFKGNSPFGEGHKKSEFPDAFILSAIEGYSKKKGVKSYILSNDKDIIQYKSTSAKVLIKESIGELIDEVHKYLDKETYNFIDARSFQSNYELVKVIKEDYNDHFYDEVAQIVSDNPYYEDGDSDIVSIEVSDLIRHNILEIEDESTTVEYFYDVEVVASVDFNDLSTGFYDKEDGKWWGVEHVSEEKTYNAKIRIIVNHLFSLKEKTFSINIIDNFEIESLEEL